MKKKIKTVIDAIPRMTIGVFGFATATINFVLLVCPNVTKNDYATFIFFIVWSLLSLMLFILYFLDAWDDEIASMDKDDL